ncbi:MAG: hypothetical protein ACXVXN_06080 [Mycobacteriaceae bacterium]
MTTPSAEQPQLADPGAGRESRSALHQRLSAEAVRMLAALQHCTQERARLALVDLSQHHHIRVSVLSAALVAVVHGSEEARNPSTGTMVVACALWRRELEQMKFSVAVSKVTEVA